ncbi:MAG TPA: energy transducer TonB [Bryobacteraceae bacterium]|nr:energy transducer TonB [Bryobacteraceae bacterium]
MSENMDSIPLAVDSKVDNKNGAQYDPSEHLDHLLAEQLEEPWFKSLYESVRDLIHPKPLPPLQVTSKPVAVKDIWGLYGRKKQSGAYSLAIHATVVVLLFTLASSKAVQQAAKDLTTTLIAPDLAPYQPKAGPQKPSGGGGGGGDRSPLPAAKGRLPKISPRQFTPPVQVFNNLNPKLPMEPTIIAPPDVNMPNVNMAQYGDPLAKIGPPSNGPGSGGGIGSGSGGGVGSGRGPGFGPGEGGGFGGGVFRVGGGVTAPVPLYRPEPEYSEEARKAKYQGTVVLYVEVDPTGRPRNLRVMRSLGLGLDEKALEAVEKWKFRPGYKDGKPVTVAATVEVNFRLL